MSQKPQEKRTFNDRLVWFISEKLAPVFAKIGETSLARVVMGALTEMSSLLIVGSIFLLLAVYGQTIPVIGPKFVVVYQMTMGILSLYASMAIGASYAKIHDLSQMTGGFVGLSSFLLITTSGITNNTLATGSFGANGLFAAILAAYLSMSVYRFCRDKKIVIRMPAGVPEGVSNAFSALIPIAFIASAAWLVKSVIGFDLVSFLSKALTPLFTAADSIYVFVARIFVGMLLWSVGLHGCIMTGTIFTPFVTAWLAENAEAAARGVAGVNLPHIWTQPLERMVLWTSAAWGLLILMYLSKVPHVRKLAVAATPAAVFTIIEPLVFGLPIVLNAYLLIPFVLSATLAAIVSYAATAIGLVSRTFASVPWSTPPPILAYVSTGGDWRAVILVLLNVLIGVVVYYPFFRVYEKKEMEKLNQEAGD